MSVFDSRPEKRIACQLATVSPRYLGTDEHGAVHYWDHHARTVIVVDGEEAATTDAVTVDGADTRFADLDRPLKHWRIHVATERGWADCTISASPALRGGL